MRMGPGHISVVTVASIRKSKLQNFAQRLDQHDIAIHGGQTHTRKIILKLFVDVFSTRVALTQGQNLGNSQALRCEPVTVFLELFYDSFKSFPVIIHSDWRLSNIVEKTR